MDQMAVQNEKISRPKNIAQMSSSVLMRPSYQKKGSTKFKSRHQNSHRVIIHLFLDQVEAAVEELRRTTKNMQENLEALNADLRNGGRILTATDPPRKIATVL